jgi:hypothetical protein
MGGCLKEEIVQGTILLTSTDARGTALQVGEH